MLNFIVRPIKRIKGIIFLPGDKSISHRAVMIGAIAKGTTLVENLSFGEDCLRTIDAFRKMGIKIVLTEKPFFNADDRGFSSRMTADLYPRKSASKTIRENPRLKNTLVIIQGRGLYGLKAFKKSLYMGNSGTTMRLLLGILAGQDFRSTLTAGKSLSRRPMLRVIEPLRMMGAEVSGRRLMVNGKREEYSPITIKGGQLKAISYRLPIPSAQVKSAILLASLYAQGITSIIESIKSRDHTERMLKLFGADIKLEGLRCRLRGPQEALYSPGKIRIPGDISSAAFFLVAAVLLPESHLVIKSVGLNPTRTGIINVLKKMGADIIVHPVRNTNLSSKNKISNGVQSPKSKIHSYEPVGDIVVRGARLRGVTIEKKDVPRLIDELPILMVAASLARGKTVMRGVRELRLKETDRINSMVTNLKKMGADIKLEARSSKVEGSKTRNKEDVIIIRGKERLKGARVNSFADHRTAMSMIIAAFFAEGQTVVEDIGCIDKSFPEFMDVLEGIT